MPLRPVAARMPPSAKIFRQICLPWKNLHERFSPELLLIESGGDNLAAHFSRELADFSIYVIDVAGGDKVLRKGGPGITQSDLLVINKTDLAAAVGADLDVMDRDARAMRGDGPFVFAQIKNGIAVPDIVSHIVRPGLPRARVLQNETLMRPTSSAKRMANVSAASEIRSESDVRQPIA